ncbi:MAG: diacylglycerol kinase family protein [Candidatus Omnitrophica bacterium]|nr:diacylglycerol kinase family protein [Candidatus Omnitrophota bacterium]
MKSWHHHTIRESLLSALRGLLIVVRTERNARIIFLIGFAVYVFAIWLRCSLLEMVILLLVILTVFVSEVFNTVVEYLCDMINPETDPRIKIIKDIASGAVLVVCAGAICVGILLFLPRILAITLP